MKKPLLRVIASISTQIVESNSNFRYTLEFDAVIIKMWYYYLAAGLLSFWWFLLRPRGGGKDSPPLVTASTVVRIPLVGVIAEFLKNPNEMMKRCYNDYGHVFTIPVSRAFQWNE